MKFPSPKGINNFRMLLQSTELAYYSLMHFRMKNSIELFLLLFLLSFAGCGTLHSFKNSKKKVHLKPISKLSIKTLNCNTTECHPALGGLHQKLKNQFVEKLKVAGIGFTNDQSADFQVFIISAFEQNIEEELPRNIYFIMKDKQGNELLQIGIAEGFSTPMTKEYISVERIQRKFGKILSQSITTPVSIAQSLTKN